MAQFNFTERRIAALDLAAFVHRRSRSCHDEPVSVIPYSTFQRVGAQACLFRQAALRAPIQPNTIGPRETSSLPFAFADIADVGRHEACGRNLSNKRLHIRDTRDDARPFDLPNEPLRPHIRKLKGFWGTLSRGRVSRLSLRTRKELCGFPCRHRAAKQVSLSLLATKTDQCIALGAVLNPLSRDRKSKAKTQP